MLSGRLNLLLSRERQLDLRRAAEIDRNGDPAGTPVTRLTLRYSSAADRDAWKRLKACRLHTCEWAFYDHTKNRSGAWCNMAVCGNRAKARAYRERRAGVAGA